MSAKTSQQGLQTGGIQGRLYPHQEALWLPWWPQPGQPHPNLCFLNRTHATSIKELIEVFPLLADDIPSQNWQLPTHIENGAYSKSRMVCHNLFKDNKSFFVASANSSQFLVPQQPGLQLVSTAGSCQLPQISHNPAGFVELLHFDNISYFWCSPPSFSIATEIATTYPTTTVLSSLRDNQGQQHLNHSVPPSPLVPVSKSPGCGS